jgi:hypothetical protein
MAQFSAAFDFALANDWIVVPEPGTHAEIGQAGLKLYC